MSILERKGRRLADIVLKLERRCDSLQTLLNETRIKTLLAQQTKPRLQGDYSAAPGPPAARIAMFRLECLNACSTVRFMAVPVRHVGQRQDLSRQGSL